MQTAAINSAELAFNSDAAANKLHVPSCRPTAWQLLAVISLATQMLLTSTQMLLLLIGFFLHAGAQHGNRWQ